MGSIALDNGLDDEQRLMFDNRWMIFLESLVCVLLALCLQATCPRNLLLANVLARGASFGPNSKCFRRKHDRTVLCKQHKSPVQSPLDHTACLHVFLFRSATDLGDDTYRSEPQEENFCG